MKRRSDNLKALKGERAYFRRGDSSPENAQRALKPVRRKLATPKSF
jgi:hypothetical protein